MREALPRQLALCQRFNVTPEIPTPDQKVGLAQSARDQNLWPLNGLRHQVAGDTCGWYIWAGAQFETDPDFFAPLHVKHLRDVCPAALPYLALPPGWRFLVGPGYEDVWRDESLLRT